MRNNISIYFKNGQAFGKENVVLRTSENVLVIEESPTEYTVIPLDSILYYDTVEIR